MARSAANLRSVIATCCADFVLPPEAIATELARISHEPRLIGRGPAELAERSPDSEREFRAITDLLRKGTGIDFSCRAVPISNLSRVLLHAPFDRILAKAKDQTWF